MHKHSLSSLLVLATLCFPACHNSSSGGGSSYSGSASVGDLIEFTVSGTSVSYDNVSNGQSGTFTFTINDDNSLAITDSSGAVVAGFFVEGFALVLQMTNTGAGADQSSMVFAIERQPITNTTMSGNDYNYMQFRTNSGGMEIGYALVNSEGDIESESYWPFGAAEGDPSDAFLLDGEPMSALDMEQMDPYTLRMEEDHDPGSYSYICQSQAGIFFMDMPNGSMVCLKQQPSESFDAAWAGTYKMIYYSKSGCATSGNSETGTVEMGTGTIVLSAGATITVTDEGGNPTLPETTVTPLSDAVSGMTPLFVGSGKLSNDCNGIFHFRENEGDPTQRDIFMIPLVSEEGTGAAVAFCSFYGEGSNYDYFYGIAIKE